MCADIVSVYIVLAAGQRRRGRAYYVCAYGAHYRQQLRERTLETLHCQENIVFAVRTQETRTEKSSGAGDR